MSTLILALPAAHNGRAYYGRPHNGRPYDGRPGPAAPAARATSIGTAAPVARADRERSAVLAELERSAARAERERVWALGLDAATGRFRPNEAETAVLIETALGVRLIRAPKWSRADWFDEHRVSYDAIGPFAAGRFEQQWRRFSEQILLHLRKADLVPVDVSLFTRPQAGTVERFIADRRLTPRVFTLGHPWQH